MRSRWPSSADLDRKMLKIDVNKSGRIFDFLVQSGFLKLAYDPSARISINGKEGMMNGHGYNHVNGEYARPGLTEVHLSNGHVEGANGVR